MYIDLVLTFHFSKSRGKNKASIIHYNLVGPWKWRIECSHIQVVYIHPISTEVAEDQKILSYITIIWISYLKAAAKQTVNAAARVDHRPLPMVVNPFAMLSGKKVSSKFDLNQAYQQVLLEVDY